MASGNIQPSKADDALPVGTVRTVSGRISAATPRGYVPRTAPFPTTDLVKLDETLTWAVRVTGVRFSAYIGDLDSDTIDSAAHVLVKTQDPEYGAVLAVSPNNKEVAVVAGLNAKKVTDDVAAIGVGATTATLKEGNIIDGLIAGIRAMVGSIAH